MFFLNTYRWDFPQVAALIAPRPLLIGNSDKDKLFPLDGVVRIYNQTRRIYRLYGQTNQLGLLITEGPHADTQDLQLPVFRWFNRFLKGQDPLIEMAAAGVLHARPTPRLRQAARDEVNTRSTKPLCRRGRLRPPAEARNGTLRRCARRYSAAGRRRAALVNPALKGSVAINSLHVTTYSFQTSPR